MTPEERGDLDFLLSLSNKREWEIWGMMATDLDRLYAHSLILKGQNELYLRSIEKNDDVTDLTQSDQVLKKIMTL